MGIKRRKEGDVISIKSVREIIVNSAQSSFFPISVNDPSLSSLSLEYTKGVINRGDIRVMDEFNREKGERREKGV